MTSNNLLMAVKFNNFQWLNSRMGTFRRTNEGVPYFYGRVSSCPLQKDSFVWLLLDDLILFQRLSQHFLRLFHLFWQHLCFYQKMLPKEVEKSQEMQKLALFNQEVWVSVLSFSKFKFLIVFIVVYYIKNKCNYFNFIAF